MITLLQELKSKLQSANVEDNVLFRELVSNTLEILDIQHIEFAEAVGVSRPTVTRWVKGNAVPHPVLRPVIFQLLIKFLDIKLNG